MKKTCLLCVASQHRAVDAFIMGYFARDRDVTSTMCSMHETLFIRVQIDYLKRQVDPSDTG